MTRFLIPKREQIKGFTLVIRQGGLELYVHVLVYGHLKMGRDYKSNFPYSSANLQSW